MNNVTSTLVGAEDVKTYTTNCYIPSFVCFDLGHELLFRTKRRTIKTASLHSPYLQSSLKGELTFFSLLTKKHIKV
jgi:hypothetical protein